MGRPPPPAPPGRTGGEELVLVRRRDRLGDDHLRRSRGGADGADEGLQLRVGEELLELLDAVPLVDDDDEAVPDPETMVNPACRTGHVAVLDELSRPVTKRLAERGSVALELRDDQHAHALTPYVSPASVGGTSPGPMADQSSASAEAAASTPAAWPRSPVTCASRSAGLSRFAASRQKPTTSVTMATAAGSGSSPPIATSQVPPPGPVRTSRRSIGPCRPVSIAPNGSRRHELGHEVQGRDVGHRRGQPRHRADVVLVRPQLE